MFAAYADFNKWWYVWDNEKNEKVLGSRCFFERTAIHMANELNEKVIVEV